MLLSYIFKLHCDHINNSTYLHTNNNWPKNFMFSSLLRIAYFVMDEYHDSSKNIENLSIIYILEKLIISVDVDKA